MVQLTKFKALLLIEWSQTRQKFEEEVLALKLRCCHRELAPFPLVTISTPVSTLYTIYSMLLPMISRTDKLPVEMEPVAYDNSTIFMLKPGDQPFVALYSIDNHSKLFFCTAIKKLKCQA